MSGYEAGFRDLTEEVRDRRLAVEGTLPVWLDGTLVRNGPARWTVESARAGADAAEADHWFDGLANLTRFAVHDGELRYTNRFPRTEAYRKAVESGQFTGQFSSSGGYLSTVKAILSGEATDNASVHVAELGGELVALTETPNWIRLDRETLEYRGSLAYDDDLTAHHVTAHLRQDPETEAHWGYFTRFGRTNEYVLFRIPEGTTRREQVASVSVDRPAYMHSFALTARHAVLVEPPLVTHPTKFLMPGNGGFIDNYDWKPSRGTRFHVIRTDTGERVRMLTASPFFTFHTANAFQADGEVVVDLVSYDDAGAVADLSMGALRGGGGGFPSGELRRYRLPLSGGQPTYHRLASGVEMPRFSPAVHTQPYEHVFAQSTEMEGGNALVRVDVESGESHRWSEADVFSGEPVFVPRPDGDEEADGVVLSLCLDATERRSFLLVLSGDMEEQARAPLPHAVPFGFHGEFFPA